MSRRGLRGAVVRGGGQVAVLAALVASGLAAVPQTSVAGASTLVYDTLDSVSCPTSSFCMAVGWYDNTLSVSQSLTEEWNGTAWTTGAPAEPKGNDGSGLYGVSCVSASFCEAVGYYTKSVSGTDVQYPLAEVWNGASWALQSPAAWKGHPLPYLPSVSCPAVTFCEAAGDAMSKVGSIVPSAFAEVLNGSTWARQSVPKQQGYANGVSCVSTTDCEMVGQFSGRALAEDWNGSQWMAQSTPDPTGDGEMRSVSCLPGTSIACQAVGASKPEGWNGSTWAIEKFANPNGTVAMNAVSCSTATDCETVGSYNNTRHAPLVEAWNGSAWVMQTAPGPSGATGSGLSSTSCTSASNCEAVGNYPTKAGDQYNYAEIWNGTDWSLQAVPSL